MSNAMTSMQRTLTTLGQQEPDRVPLFLLTTLHGAKELGLTIQEYFSRSEHVVEGQMRLLKKFGGDCLYPFFHASLEMEAWGGESIFMPDGPALCGAPIIRSAEYIDGLLPPRVTDAVCLERVLETIRTLKARVGNTVPIIGVAISPFSAPVMQMGFDHYLDLIFEQPERFEKLMKINQAFTVEWANAQLAAGATAICYFDPVSSTSNVPRATYLTTGYEVAKRTIAQINGPTATHLASGRSKGIVQDIANTGTAVIGVSSMEDIGQVKQEAAGRLTLLGNLNGVEMRRWTPEQTESRVKSIIARAGRGGGLILSDNHGEIPWQVSDEVLFGIRDAVRKWGNYPLDWVAEWQEDEAT